MRTTVVAAAAGLLAAALCAGPGQSASAALIANFEGLGHLSGGGVLGGAALGVSGDGSTAVGYGDSSFSAEEAFRWQGGVINGLGSLFPTGGSHALSATYDGSVVVGWSDPLGAYEAFYWQSNTMTGLGHLPGGGNLSEAHDVSANGDVIVGLSDYTSADPSLPQATVWSQNLTRGTAFTPTPLGFLSGDSASEARGVSGDGTIAVGYSGSSARNDTGGMQAVRWELGARTIEGLGFLDGGTFSAANGISADGLTIVGFGDSNLSDHEAFRWHDDTMTGLGLLIGDESSEALAASGDGSVVVGFSESASFEREAFIWDEFHGMRSLRDVLVNELGLDLTGWTLLEATGISDDGLTIVGAGWNPDGIPEGWIATLPEPPTILILAVSGVVVTWRRRAR